MSVWKLIIEYEGTRYRGWQEQKNARTIAGEIRRSAENYFGLPVELSGSGRTDAGVHALEQVARLKAGKIADDLELMHAINDDLPPDINILRVEKAHNDFDPRRDASSRQYLYQISTRRTAFNKRLVWWVKDDLDTDAMSRACSMIKGRRDFRSFCEMREDERVTIVDVRQASIDVEGDMILFRIVATHFLWKMVRRLVGTLVEVGRGNIGEEDFRSLLANREVKSNGQAYSIAAHTAPPSGLFLERVNYDRSPERRPSRHTFPSKKHRFKGK